MLFRSAVVYGNLSAPLLSEKMWGSVDALGANGGLEEGLRGLETLLLTYRQSQGIDVRIARMFDIYGSDTSTATDISLWINQARNNKPLTLTDNPEAQCAYLYEDDFVDALLKYIQKSPEECTAFFEFHDFLIPVLNIGSPEVVSVRQVAETIRSLVPGCTSEIVVDGTHGNKTVHRCADIRWAQEFLDWTPAVSLHDGLARFISRWKQNVTADRT